MWKVKRTFWCFFPWRLSVFPVLGGVIFVQSLTWVQERKLWRLSFLSLSHITRQLFYIYRSKDGCWSVIEDGSLRQVNELAQLPLISHPGASCQPLLGYDWEWAKIIKLCHKLGGKCSTIFCFYLFLFVPSLLTWFMLFFFPSQFVSWEGTHYSYGYSAVPRIQQCIQVSVLWEYAFVLQVCERWEVGICLSVSCLSFAKRFEFFGHHIASSFEN